MRRITGTIMICVFASAAVVVAQENPLSAHNRKIWGGVKAMLLRAAESMPEEHYGFKPVETVRSYGQIIGHVADSQYAFCSGVLGQKNPRLRIEKTKTSKAELIAALTDAFAYCEPAYQSMTDATAAETFRFMGGDAPRMGGLAVNNVHTIEHYGNLVTYMRMKNIVPPTSDPEFMKQLAANN